jgi:hypothetical protein
MQQVALPQAPPGAESNARNASVKRRRRNSSRHQAQKVHVCVVSAPYVVDFFFNDRSCDNLRGPEESPPGCRTPAARVPRLVRPPPSLISAYHNKACNNSRSARIHLHSSRVDVAVIADEQSTSVRSKRTFTRKRLYIIAPHHYCCAPPNIPLRSLHSTILLTMPFPK